MTVITWGHDGLRVELAAGPDGSVAGPPRGPRRATATSPPEVRVAARLGSRLWRSSPCATGGPRRPSGSCTPPSGSSCVSSVTRARSSPGRPVRRHRLTVHLAGAGLAVDWQLTSYDGVAAATATTTVRNDGDTPVAVLAVTSLVTRIGGSRRRPRRRRGRERLAGGGALAAHAVAGGRRRPVARGARRRAAQRARRRRAGFLVHGRPAARRPARRPGAAAPRGPGRSSTTGRGGGRSASASTAPYLALLGPTDLDHQWRRGPRSPARRSPRCPRPVAVGGDVDGAVAALTAHRRASWRAHPDRTGAAGRVQRLHEHAHGRPDHGQAAAADRRRRRRGRRDLLHRRRLVRRRPATGGTASASGSRRAPGSRGGIEEVLDHIRERGHGAGPVAGARGRRRPQPGRRQAAARGVPAARRRAGARARPLPPRPAAPRRRSRTWTRWSTGSSSELGVGYFKLDYNIDPGAGTDHDADSGGAGLLEHNRAHLAWLDGVLDRHPGAGAGELRVGRHADGLRDCWPGSQLQSTSDQQDPLRYPPIAAAAPLSMLPEQAANWAYPQPDMTDEQIAFTLCTGDARPALPLRAARRG